MQTPKIKRSPVSSSNIKSIGYDEGTRTLEIEFARGNHVYQYSPVTSSAYQELLNATSIGKHFHAHIKDNTNLDTKKIS